MSVEQPMHRNSDTGPGYDAYGPEGHGYFEPRPEPPPHCVRCGRFTACEDPDARYYFEPDSDRGPEVNEWTCGPCRRHQAGGGA